MNEKGKKRNRKKERRFQMRKHESENHRACWRRRKPCSYLAKPLVMIPTSLYPSPHRVCPSLSQFSFTRLHSCTVMLFGDRKFQAMSMLLTPVQGQPCVHGEFQASQSFTVRPCFEVNKYINIQYNSKLNVMIMRKKERKERSRLGI